MLRCTARTTAVPTERCSPSSGSTFSKRCSTSPTVKPLEQLEFNLLWHHALRLDIEETHLPQKTLHNFRVRLMQHDGGRLAFQETTDRIIQALGIRTGKQRLDSTHIMSNIATLTRLGLFCETMRLFLRALRWEHPELRPVVPEGLLGRYLKEEDEATHYEDAHTGEGRRRLSVCARDLYRLVDRFRGTTAAQLEEYRLLERLLREQCHVGKHRDGRPGDDDDDAGECKVPVALKDPKQVSADSLQFAPRPGCDLQRPQGEGVRGAGGGDLPRGERHPAHHPRGGDPLEWERHRRERAGR